MNTKDDLQLQIEQNMLGYNYKIQNGALSSYLDQTTTSTPGPLVAESVRTQNDIVIGQKSMGLISPSEDLSRSGSNLGKKADTGKAPVTQGLFQYFARALIEIAKISQYGAEKYKLDYSDVNWLRVADGINRYDDAHGRHDLGRFIDGPVDPESGHLHLAMRAWNDLAVLELTLREKDGKS